MKTTLFAILFTLCGATAIAGATTTGEYCPARSINPYLYLCLATSTYPKGEPVTFRLHAGKIPIFIGPLEHPWKILDAKGNIIYAPSSTPATGYSNQTFDWIDTWNQIDNSGKQVRKGDYMIVFPPESYVVQPVTITITKKDHQKKGKHL